MTKQRSFHYQFDDKLNEVNFFVNDTNSYAFKGLIDKSHFNSFLYGPKKSGKSFLGEIWLKRYSAIKFDKNFEAVIREKKNVLIDDFTSFDQEKIFHIINNCTLNNLKILIISSRRINEIKFKFNDLSSRLKTFNNFEINQPNDEMLITILTKLLIDKQFIISSNEIFEYILRRVDRTYISIHDVVDKLDILSLEKKRQLTIPLIKEIL